LETYWEKEQGKIKSTAGKPSHAIYTVVAKEDCVVWRWSYQDMEKLLSKSADLRAALTRAMTSAIVGKVIDFTVSRSSARPTWQTWLDNWRDSRTSLPVVTTLIGRDDGRDKEENDNDDDEEEDPTDEAGPPDVQQTTPANA